MWIQKKKKSLNAVLAIIIDLGTMAYCSKSMQNLYTKITCVTLQTAQVNFYIQALASKCVYPLWHVTHDTVNADRFINWWTSADPHLYML